MDRFIQFIITHRKAVVAAFLAVAVVGACLIPFVKTNYDMVDYLPDGVQSTEAVHIMNEEFTAAVPNASVWVHDVSVSEALEVKERIAAIEGVEGVMWLDDVADIAVPLSALDSATVENYYRDGSAMYSVTITEGKEVKAVPALRDLCDELSAANAAAGGEGKQNAVVGEAMTNAQMQLSTVEEVLGAMAILVPIILFLLIISTMSWIEPLLFVAAIGVSILINMGTNIVFGEVSFITYSVSPILQLAVSLDYAIFLLHSFAAHRKTAANVEEAMARAMRSSASTIAASAVTTLFGFAALAFMQFEIGADLGINLVKGIVFSFVTVIVFLPALTMMLYKLIDRTAHRRFMPDFSRIDTVLSKIRIPALGLVAVLIVPAFLGQQNVVFTYLNTGSDPGTRFGDDIIMVDEEFGRQNPFVILVPRGDAASEARLSEALKDVENVRSVISYSAAVGSAIPEGYLDDSVVEQFYSENYARIICYLSVPAEGSKTFATVQEIQELTAQYYDTFYTTGQSANLYDMKQVVDVDNVVVSLVAIVAIFLVLLVTFRSLALPIVLLLTIESGIWINLAIPYFLGEPINFIGYLVINTVQLGATIDYAILLTTHYLEQRRQMPARPAVRIALGRAFPSLLVSAGILATAGFALGATSTLSAVASLGLLLGRGAILSLILVTCFLPGLFIFLDGFIRRTTWRANFYLPPKEEQHD